MKKRLTVDINLTANIEYPIGPDGGTSWMIDGWMAYAEGFGYGQFDYTPDSAARRMTTRVFKATYI